MLTCSYFKKYKLNERNEKKRRTTENLHSSIELYSYLHEREREKERNREKTSSLRKHSIMKQMKCTLLSKTVRQKY